MMNISNNTIRDQIKTEDYTSLQMLSTAQYVRQFAIWLYVLIAICLIILFLPWTQNVRGEGRVTTLRPEQRRQSLQSTIDGRIHDWYAMEGDTVKQGDTLVQIRDIKDEYFDPELLNRTREQIVSKENSLIAYDEKIQALDAQIEALTRNRDIKYSQAVLKVEADSLDAVAARTNEELSFIQYRRADTLFNQGLESRFELEQKTLKWQEARAKKTSAENRFLNSKTELSAIMADYAEKIAKSSSERYGAVSAKMEVEAEIAKLRNTLSNYSIRMGLYYITAPQNAIVTKIYKTGIGENIKAGDQLLELLPTTYDMAVEIFVRPVDLPLMHPGATARLEFDGWPTIIFSGWPSTSFGTFGAEVYAVDNVISPNGKYRILLVPQKEDTPWPKEVRFGSGVRGIMLLNDVPVWYELWRLLNGFPPEYYTPEMNSK